MSGHPNKRITPVVAFGRAPDEYSYDEYNAVEVHFHEFEDIPTMVEDSVASPEFTCLGRRWRLALYPSGSDELSDYGNIAVDLIHLSNGTIKVEFNLSVKNEDGKQIAHFNIRTSFESAKGVSEGHRRCVPDFASRMEIVDSLPISGALVIEVRMKQIEATDTPVPPFIPDNPLRENILKKFMDEESADVLIEVGSGETSERTRTRNKGTRKTKKAKTTSLATYHSSVATFYAHHLILKDGAPALAELCNSAKKTSPIIQITDVKPIIFRHMLCYIYGGGIFENDMKENAKDIIEACDKYGVVNLKLEAEACYAKHTTFTVDNVLDNLLYADAKNCALLKEAVMDFIVENGRDIIGKVSFEDVPGSMMTDLLTAVTRGKKKDDGPRDYDTMRVSTLRKKLHEKGLDIDGSREMMIGRLKEKS